MSLENQYQQTPKAEQCQRCSAYLDSSNACFCEMTASIDMFRRDPAFVNYEFLEPIGAGGMGVIFKARQIILNKVVAVKTLHPHVISPQAFKRFQLEGQVASLLSHPFIVTVHDFGITQSGQTFMVMDFIDGETLGSLLRRLGQLSERHFLNIFIDVCDALAHAHGRSVVHRDVKSSNIMIVKGDVGKEEIRIMDFGVAKLMSDYEARAVQVTRTGEVIGTAVCMSPEQARGGKVDHRSDLYALGCVMYESLASVPPYVGNSPLETMLMHLEKQPAPIIEASMGHAVDPRIERIILCLLEKDPERRYQSMKDLKEDLQNLRNTMFLGEKAVDFRMPKTPTGESKKSQLVPAMFALSLIAVLIFVLIIFLFKNQLPALKEVAQDKRSILAKAEPSGRARANSGGDTSSARASLELANTNSENVIPAEQNIVRTGLESQLAHGDLRVGITGAIRALAEISDDDLKSFDGLFPNTRVVDLSHAEKITDVGLKHLSNLQLTEIDLNDSGARDLDWIVSQSELKKLYIAGSKLTPEAFRNIGKLNQLQELDIDRTDFKDSDIDSIGWLTNLEKLNVAQTQLSLFGYDRLLNMFPKAHAVTYRPAVVAGSDFLTGSLLPIDHRPIEQLEKDADSFILKKEWRLADIALEKIILRKLSEVGYGRATRFDYATLASAEGKRGNCLQAMNLPYAAVYMYNLAASQLTQFNLPTEYVADMCTRAAGVCESMPVNADSLSRAVAERSLVNEKLTGESRPDLVQWRRLNAEVLAKDKEKLTRLNSAK